jgi:hypothetical protein
VSIPGQKQGEGITFSADGRSLLLSSEGVGEPLWQMPVPANALPPRTKSASPPNSSGNGDASPSTSGSKKKSVAGLVLVAGAVLLVAALFARRRGS